LTFAESDQMSRECENIVFVQLRTSANDVRDWRTASQFGGAEYFFLDRRIGGGRRSGNPKRTHCLNEIGSGTIIGLIGEAR